jgi:hypothetical protein
MGVAGESRASSNLASRSALRVRSAWTRAWIVVADSWVLTSGDLGLEIGCEAFGKFDRDLHSGCLREVGNFEFNRWCFYKLNWRSNGFSTHDNTADTAASTRL